VTAVKNIRIAVRPVVHNLQQIAASLLILRGEHWEVCGVFTLLHSEWQVLLEFASSQGIHITYEHGPIPVEGTEGAPVGE
jgi:hypothetical protein